MSETDTMRPHAGGIDFPAASSTGDEVIAAERLHGPFTRQLFLGETLDAERRLASYETSVLTLRIPERRFVSRQPRAYGVADDTRRCVAADAAMCLLLRLREPDVVGRTIEDLTPPENRYRSFPCGCVSPRGNAAGRFELLMPDGARVLVEYSATAKIEPGRHLSILVFPARSRSHPAGAISRGRPAHNERTPGAGDGGDGMSSAWIAAALKVSPYTIETHVRHCWTSSEPETAPTRSRSG